jgi:hypothetical protein
MARVSRADQRSFTREPVDRSLIAEEAAETLLEPFQRSATRSGTERIRTEHAGVGLGLAIVNIITRAHDETLAPEPVGSSESRCNHAPRHRTLADYDQG